jgi:hypothetical protein
MCETIEPICKNSIKLNYVFKTDVTLGSREIFYGALTIAATYHKKTKRKIYI